MRKYLRAARRAAVMLFRRGNDADWALVDEISAYNLNVMEGVINGLMDGEIGAAYIRMGRRLDVYTKSLRGEFVQISHFCELDGNMEALSHADVHTAAEALERTAVGHYINILR